TLGRRRGGAGEEPLEQVRHERDEDDDERRTHRVVRDLCPLVLGHDFSSGASPSSALSALIKSSMSPATSSRGTRSSAATSTTVRPSSERVRIQVRRGRTNSDPSRPSRPSETPSNGSHTTGVW